jgi:hypothetical protein
MTKRLMICGMCGTHYATDFDQHIKTKRHRIWAKRISDACDGTGRIAYYDRLIKRRWARSIERYGGM